MKQVYENYYIGDEQGNSYFMSDIIKSLMAFEYGATMTDFQIQPFSTHYYSRLSGLSCSGSKITVAKEIDRRNLNLSINDLWKMTVSEFFDQALDIDIFLNNSGLFIEKYSNEISQEALNPPVNSIGFKYYKNARINPQTNKLIITSFGLEFLAQKTGIDSEILTYGYNATKEFVWIIGKLTNLKGCSLFYVNSVPNTDPQYGTLQDDGYSPIDSSEEDSEQEDGTTTQTTPTETPPPTQTTTPPQQPPLPPTQPVVVHPDETRFEVDSIHPLVNNRGLSEAIRYILPVKEIESYLDEVILRNSLEWNNPNNGNASNN